MLRFLYCLYQLLILLPVTVLDTIVMGSLIAVVCPLLPKRWQARYSSIMTGIWGWIIVRATLLPVTVEGREHIRKGQSYVVVANHQGCYDIFLLIGFLRMDLKWVMKASLFKIPFLGKACSASGFISVDGYTAGKVRDTYTHALNCITDGVSLMIFPEGRRSYDGTLGVFKRGGYLIADQLQLPVLPVTVCGTHTVMPRQRDFRFAHWKPLRIVIHEAVNPIGTGHENVEHLMRRSREAIETVPHRI